MEQLIFGTCDTRLATKATEAASSPAEMALFWWWIYGGFVWPITKIYGGFMVIFMENLYLLG